MINRDAGSLASFSPFNTILLQKLTKINDFTLYSVGDNSRCAHFALDRVSSDDYSAVWVTTGSLLGITLFVIMKMTLGSDESPVLGDFWFWARCRKIHLVEPQLQLNIFIYQWFLVWALMIFATGGLDSNSILVMKRTMLLISSKNKQIGFLDDALS